MSAPSAEQQVDEDLAALTSLARERGFTLRDVPRDGNCMFTAVQLSFERGYWGSYCSGGGSVGRASGPLALCGAFLWYSSL